MTLVHLTEHGTGRDIVIDTDEIHTAVELKAPAGVMCVVLGGRADNTRRFIALGKPSDIPWEPSCSS